MQRLTRESKSDLGKLPPKKSADEKVFPAAAMKKTCSVSNRWLAERLQMGQAASVSQFARRWQTQPKKTRETSALVKDQDMIPSDRL